MLAARDGHVETIEVLINAGADVNLTVWVSYWINNVHALAYFGL